MRCRPSWSLSALGSKHACDKNRWSSVTYASISVFPPYPIPSSRTTKYVVCCCFLHIKSRSDLYSVPSNIRIGPTDANAFRGHRLTTQKGYTYAAYKTRNVFLKKLLDRKRRFEIFRLCTKYVVCCCFLHIKSRSDLYSVPSNIRIGPTDANAFRGHRLTTQKGYTYAAYKTRNVFLKKLLDRKRRFEIFRLCT